MNKLKLNITRNFIAIIALLSLISVNVSAAPQKVLRVGYQKFNSINILKGSGELEKALKDQNITVKWYEFAAGPQLLEALSTGAIDIGHAADAPSVFAQAAGKSITYLAVEKPNPLGIGIVVNNNSAIKSVADLKGKKIATGRGWNAQYLLALALKQAGLTYQDIKPAYVSSAADATAALESGSVDAATLWDPFLAAAEKKLPVHVLRSGEGLSNNRTFYLSTTDFVNNNPQTVKIFFSRLEKVSQWANNHPEEVAEKLAPQLGITPDVLLLATKRRNYEAGAITPPVIKEQQQVADTFQELNLIPQKITVGDIVYPKSFVKNNP
ncbi:aliphatic sulfonate ABC transporter substrate-binding protein [Klebsiella sp. WOUb02]|uniref:aliphatic sulfonate ABC transporter substrate-binding protein n=1 Tax=Klebsiella sp. WOUb02 TaxID=3161071 RepID=UPI003CFB1198